MGRKQHAEYGDVNERAFPLAKLDDRLRAWLEKFKTRKIICDYRIDDDALVLWRPCHGNETADRFFRDRVGSTERMTYSGALFRRVCEKLEAMDSGHGALHPGNIIVPPGRVDLVDALFNSVLLSPNLVSYSIWLWRRSLPKGWTLEDWDLVSLLRTAALLSREPASWLEPLSREKAAEICRDWAEKVTTDDSSADFLFKIRKAVSLLDAIVQPALSLDEKLEELRQRMGKTKVLRKRDEDEIRACADDYQLDREALDKRLTVWLNQNDYRGEHELDELAEELLDAGRWGSSRKLVTARACRAAERAYAYYGMSSADAEDGVKQILTTAGWGDERQATLQCQQLFNKRLQAPGQIPEGALVEELRASLAKELGCPSDVAGRLVDLEVERRLLGLVD